MPQDAVPTARQNHAGFEFLTDLGGDLVIDTRVIPGGTGDTLYLTLQVDADPLDAQAEHARLDASPSRRVVPPVLVADASLAVEADQRQIRATLTVDRPDLDTLIGHLVAVRDARPADAA